MYGDPSQPRKVHRALIDKAIALLVNTCPNCGEQQMQEERQHWRCPKCGFIEPCCTGGPQ